MKAFQDRYSTVFRRATWHADRCPPSEALARLAAGRAWPWQRRRLVDHLGRCSDCADDYRVLAAARGGLIGALEAHAGAAPGAAPAWLRPGLAAAALAGITALGIAVLVETDGPGPWAGPDMLASHGAVSPADDRVFKSDFGEPKPDEGPLFRDDFGG